MVRSLPSLPSYDPTSVPLQLRRSGRERLRVQRWGLRHTAKLMGPEDRCGDRSGRPLGAGTEEQVDIPGRPCESEEPLVLLPQVVLAVPEVGTAEVGRGSSRGGDVLLL